MDCGSEDTEELHRESEDNGEFEMFCQGEAWEKNVELGVEEPIWNTFGFSYVFLKEETVTSFEVGQLYIKHKRKRQKPRPTQG